MGRRRTSIGGARSAALALLGLACACPGSPPQEPEEPRASSLEQRPESEAASGPDARPQRALPPLADIVFEQRWSSTRGVYEAAHSAGATFPLISIYLDGSVLYMRPEDIGVFELRRTRVEAAQVDELRRRIDALAPLDRIQGSALACQDDGAVHSVAHGVLAHRLRVGDEQLCVLGCPAEPADLRVAFAEVRELAESFTAGESEPWIPSRGHVAAVSIEGRPSPPWTDEVLEPLQPRAWLLLDPEQFEAVWRQAGERAGPRRVELDDASYVMSVVPWRPGEDRSEELPLYNELVASPSPCPLGARRVPSRRE